MKRALFAWLVVFPLAVCGQDLPKSEMSVSAGYLFEGEVYVWQPNQYGSVGETFLIKADYVGYFSDFVGMGGYVAYGSPWYWAYETVGMFEVGVVFKARFQAGEKFLFKVPVYVGYRSFGDPAGNALGINLSGVLQYQGENVKPFIDIGFLSQPIGGNDATDMTFGPVFQASLGVAFTF